MKSCAFFSLLIWRINLAWPEFALNKGKQVIIGNWLFLLISPPLPLFFGVSAFREGQLGAAEGTTRALAATSEDEAHNGMR